MLLFALGLLGAIPGLAGFAGWLGRVLHADPNAQPAPVREGQALGAATEDERSLEQENEQLRAIAAANAHAVAQRVRDDPDSAAVSTDPAAPVNNLPGEHFRD